MFQSLDMFQTAAAMAKHAGTRQAMTARNVANADTPGYVAQRLPSFAQAMATDTDHSLRKTRGGHVGGSQAIQSQSAIHAATTEPAPNGNNVSVEEEMLHAVEITREHNRALAIYRHTLTVLRTSIGR